MKQYFNEYIHSVLAFLMIPVIGFSQNPNMILQNSHRGRPKKIVINPNNKIFATCGYDNVIKLYDCQSGINIKNLVGHSNSIDDLAFSSNGRLLASLSWLRNNRQTEIVIWNLENGKRKIFREGLVKMHNIRFIPDSYKIVLFGDGRYSNAIEIYDLMSGKWSKRIRHNSMIEELEISPNGQSVVFGDNNGQFVILDISSGKKILKKHPKTDSIDVQRIGELGKSIMEITAVDISSDGKYYAFGSDNGYVEIGELLTHKILYSNLRNKGEISCVKFHPITNNLFIAGKNIDLSWFYRKKRMIIDSAAREGELAYFVDVIDANNWKKTFENVCSSEVEEFSFLNNGAYSISLKNDTIEVWKVTNKFNKASQFTYVSSSEINELAFDPGRDDFVLNLSNHFGRSNELIQFDFSRLHLKKKIELDDGVDNLLYHSKDKKFYFTSSSAIDKIIFTYDQITDSVDVIFEDRPDFSTVWGYDKDWNFESQTSGYTSFQYLNWSSDNKYLITCTNNDSIFVFDEQMNKVQTISNRHIDKDCYLSTIMSHDNKHLINSCRNGQIEILNLHSGKMKFIKAHNERSHFISLHPQKNWFISVGFSRKATIKLWDIKTGKILKRLKAHDYGVNTAAFDSKGILMASGGVDGQIVLWNTEDWTVLKKFNTHNSSIVKLYFMEDSKNLVSAGSDGMIKFYNLDTLKEVLTIQFSDNLKYIAYTPEGYYYSPNKLEQNLAFVLNEKGYRFEQFDLKYNSPDIVFSALGLTKESLIDHYKNAYKKRLQKLNFTEDMLSSDFHTPELTIDAQDSSIVTENETFTFTINASDTKYYLDRLNVWINNIPIYNINLRDKKSQFWEQDLIISLSSGENKIQVSVLNQAGAESLKETFYINYKPPSINSNLHLIALGASKYSDSSMNLEFPSKDVKDLNELLKNNKNIFDKVYHHLVLDDQVNLKIVEQLKKKLMQTNIDDVVILFYSGHGLLDIDYNYYLATYDVNFSNPKEGGLLYEDFENLMNDIPARKKLILIDACHSGELDTEYLTNVKQINQLDSAMQWRSNYVDSIVAHSELGAENSFELMKELFIDLRRGNGATVISSSGGVELAYETSKYKNGIFTYSLMEGLREMAADDNGDERIMVSELKKFLSLRVPELTNGLQRPTSRLENISNDFRIW